jgi:hypothetical protein
MEDEIDKGWYIPDKFQNTYQGFVVITMYIETYEPYSNIDLKGVAKRQGIKCTEVWR